MRMARFHFQVTDTEGKVRTGTMEARNLEDARSVILKKGFSVVDLKEALEAPAVNIQVHKKAANSRHHVGPVARRDYQPGLGERIAALTPPASVVRFLLILVALGGGAWMYTTWKDPSQAKPGSPARSREPELHPLKLLVTGSVKVEGSSNLGDVQVTLDIPEIPYQQTWEWTKLDHPREGHFVARLEFQSSRKARQLVVRARKPGLGEAHSEVLHLKPGGGEIHNVDLTIEPHRK